MKGCWIKILKFFAIKIKIQKKDNIKRAIYSYGTYPFEKGHYREKFKLSKEVNIKFSLNFSGIKVK